MVNGIKEPVKEKASFLLFPNPFFYFLPHSIILMLMSQNKKRNIALLISQMDRSYHSIMWHSVEKEIRSRGHNCIIFLGKTLLGPFGDDTQHNIIYTLANHRDIDGYFIVSGSLATCLDKNRFHEFLAPLKDRPMVCTDKVENLPSVLINNRSGIKEVVHHLVEEHQCKNIFYISGPMDQWDSRERFEGFKEGLKEKGIPFDPDMVYYGNMDAGSGFTAARKIEELGLDSIDAIVGANDDMLLTAMKYLQEKGAHFPEDAACVGFDDTREGQVALPALSSVAFPYEEQVRRALDILLGEIEGGKTDSGLTLNTRFIPRQSCGCRENATQLMRGPLDSVLQGWVDKVLAYCRIPEREPPQKGTLDQLSTLFYRFIREHSLDSWLLVIERVRKILESQDGKDEKGCYRSWEMLLSKAQILYYEVFSRKLQRGSIVAEERQLDIQRVSQYIITLQDTNALAGSIYYNFPVLGIRKMRMVFWDGPVEWDKALKWSLPEKSEILAEMTPDGNFYSDERVLFSTEDWLPSWFLESGEPFSMVVLPLFFGELQFGYLLLQIGVNIDTLYETLRGQVASAVKGIKLIEQESRISKELQKTVEELRESKERIERISIIDELTGLYNRRGFVTLAQQELDLAKRKHREFLLIFMDMDGLKIINDTYGHKAGDEAISEASRQLQKTFRSTDIIARLGGDEFTILAIETTIQEFLQIRTRLDESIEEYNRTGSQPFTLSISMGCAPFKSGHQYTLDELMAEADRNLYKEKKQKKEARRKLEEK